MSGRAAGRPAARPALPPAAPRPRWRRAARYANEAVLPFYLLHEPVIVAASWLIVRWHAPVPANYAALVIVSSPRLSACTRHWSGRSASPGSCPA